MKKTIKILMLCLITTFGYAQKKMSKTSQSIKVNKDVVVELNTSYVEIELDTWNKDVVEVEAYIEGVKLSEEELKVALKNWNLKVEGSTDKVVISSGGGSYPELLFKDNFSNVLQNLEYHLAELPEIPELPEMPNFPALPEMPKIPELPELPKGVKSINFDYERYLEEGESYLTKWSKKYEEKGGKELQKRMEEWAKSFSESGYQEKMEKWGEEFGKKFSDEWTEKMEIWGERFEKQMDVKNRLIEERTKSIKNEAKIYRKDAERLKRITEIENRKSERIKSLESRKDERKVDLDERKTALKNRQIIRTHILSNHSDVENYSKVRKVIKIKIPKKAKLKTNIRHGELKISSVIHNMKGDISHSFLLAEHINGSETSINVSYSPVMINTWDLGTLNLNFVDKAQIKIAQNLVLNSKSSNVTVGKLMDTAIIDGSFGDLTISDLNYTFKNLNLVLENSDALINLPKDVDYTLYFKGNRSKFNNKTTEQKTIRNYPDGESSNRNIIVNAKFSDVIIN